MFGIEKLETTGFSQVEGRPELSYFDPRIVLSHSSFIIGRPDSHLQGIYRGGLAMETMALSNSWLSRSMRDGRHRLTLRGTEIGWALSPETDRDGINTHSIDYLNVVVDAGATVELHFEAVIGDPVGQQSVPRLTGLFLQASVRLERMILENAFTKLRSSWHVSDSNRV